MADGAIGIFDSGVGGLTVARRIEEALPDESIVYLGDTARVPYGTKSHDTVVRYARNCARVVMERGVKLLVVACNTASAHGLEVLQAELPLPVVGVVEPGARAAVEKTRIGIIGVTGTAGTIGSGEYQRRIAALAPQVTVVAKACPLFVPLAEEGWTEGPVPRGIVAEYLDELLDARIDTLVLGCTHYPLLKDVIANYVGPDIELVDSAEATAAAVKATLDAMALRSDNGHVPSRVYMVSDDPARFARTGQRFLGRELNDVEWVDF